MTNIVTPARTSLYVVLARRAPLGVIFRRGPSRQVLLLTWNTDTHELRSGQWFKGRIYERRCDLSPSGEKLIYFAAKHRPPYYSWTVVSRPPYLTALAMWPKGDAWGGGGSFQSERIIRLNHRAGERDLAEGFRLPKAITLADRDVWSGRGEDNPIFEERLKRDGWTLSQAGEHRENKFGSKVWFDFPQPRAYARVRGRWRLETQRVGVHERDGPWYILHHRVTDLEGREVLSFGRSDWADWSRSGEILLARDGRLYRCKVDSRRGPDEPEELMDLRSLRFEPVIAPPEAGAWSGRAPRGKKVIQ